MPDDVAPIEIPHRALFKAGEVCDLVKLQPYVLRSWEAEFPDLGVAKASGGARVYRRADVEQVVRIRHLLLVEGLTLAGARRKLEVETAPAVADEPAIDALIGQNARERLTAVKRGLRSILDLLSPNGSGDVFRLAPPEPVAAPAHRPRATVVVRAAAKAARGKAPATKARAKPSTPARRKRSA